MRGISPGFNAMMLPATIPRRRTPGRKLINRRCLVMEAVDYFVLILVVAAYLVWIFQGEDKPKSADSAAGD